MRIVNIISHSAFRLFASLKLGVVTLITLSFVLAAATVVESIYGARAVYQMVYGTWWFYGLLFFLGINVLCSALSRYPWKKRHIGFLTTHSGILVLLLGSFLTMRFGIDGSLPVAEGSQGNQVLVSGLRLALTDEQSKKKHSFPVRESGLSRQGRLMVVDITEDERLVVDRYLPRTVFQRQVLQSPISGVGVPAVQVEIFNKQNKTKEWLMGGYTKKRKEVVLGPVVLSLSNLWTSKEESEFLKVSKQVKPAKIDGIGSLVLSHKGKNFSIKINQAMKKWKKLKGSDLEVFVKRYLPHAVVRNNKLTSKSQEPKNPAVQIEVRNSKGVINRHTVFALYPEFTTFHKGHNKKAEGNSEDLEVMVRMISGSYAGRRTGNAARLEFAQTKDKRLIYRVLDPGGKVQKKGGVAPEDIIELDWMDLKFRVAQWFTSSVEKTVPRYVEKIEGSDAGFVTAIHLKVEKSSEKKGTPEKSSQGLEFWLTEGGVKSVPLGARRIAVQLSRAAITLPFDVFLKKFEIKTDPGTNKAASYESQVRVKDPRNGIEKTALIRMNEPLKYGGFTFYQSSYQLRGSQPPISIFSVNFDPGRMVKYIGSVILIIGLLLIFYLNPHYWDILLKGGRKVK